MYLCKHPPSRLQASFSHRTHLFPVLDVNTYVMFFFSQQYCSNELEAVQLNVTDQDISQSPDSSDGSERIDHHIIRTVGHLFLFLVGNLGNVEKKQLERTVMSIWAITLNSNQKKMWLS